MTCFSSYTDNETWLSNETSSEYDVQASWGWNYKTLVLSVYLKAS